MNMMLHGIGSEKSVPVVVGDALAADPGERFEVVLANPPFRKKSSTVIVGEDGRTSTEKDTIERDDFWATTSNKQLNFVQHIKTLLATHGRAAVVLPDNVLFEGGAGETIRKKLLHECDVHTLLRLPTGLFYAQGVKANVVFFERKPASETPWTKKLWIYDLRTNTSAGQWQDIQKATLMGGDIKDNPIFTGSLGIYNGVVLHKAARVTQGVHSTAGTAVSNTRRAVLCGAQAAAIAFGSENGATKYTWVEEMFDYGNQFGVAAGAIWGLKKTKYIPEDNSATNAEDFGTIVVSTYAARPTAA